MNDNTLNITPLQIAGAISIEAKNVAVLIDGASIRGEAINMEAVKASVQRMASLTNAITNAPAPESAPAGDSQ